MKIKTESVKKGISYWVEGKESILFCCIDFHPCHGSHIKSILPDISFKTFTKNMETCWFV